MNTLRFFLLLALTTTTTIASKSAYALQNNDTIPEARLVDFEVKPFVRLSFDISAVARNFVEPQVQQYELGLDAEILRNWFAALEAGFMQASTEQEDFSYRASGFFFRLGADFNLLGRAGGMQNDLVLVGLRYGFSNQQHEAPYYQTDNPYWGPHEGSVETSGYYLHWIEFTGGVKTEVFRNFFLGWSLRTRIRLAESRDPILDPYYIAGFGHGKRKAPVMVHFNLMYRFPLPW